MEANTQFNYVSRPLNSWAQSIKLIINGVDTGIANSFNLETSYLLKLLNESVCKRNDLAGIDLGWLDKAGYFEQIGTADNHATIRLNTGLTKKLSALASSATRRVLDALQIPLIADGNQYIPSANKFKLRWTKANNRNTFNVTGGGNASDFDGAAVTNAGLNPLIDNVKTNFTGFTWHLQYKTPNNQLKNTLNLMMEMNDGTVRSYTTQIHVAMKEHLQQTTT